MSAAELVTGTEGPADEHTPPHLLGGTLLDTIAAELRAMALDLGGKFGWRTAPERAQMALEIGVRAAATVDELHQAIRSLSRTYRDNGITGRALAQRAEVLFYDDLYWRILTNRGWSRVSRRRGRRP